MLAGLHRVLYWVEQIYALLNILFLLTRACKKMLLHTYSDMQVLLIFIVHFYVIHCKSRVSTGLKLDIWGKH